MQRLTIHLNPFFQLRAFEPVGGIHIDLIFLRRLIKLFIFFRKHQADTSSHSRSGYSIMFKRTEKRSSSTPTCWAKTANSKQRFSSKSTSRTLFLAISFHPHFRIFSFILYDRRFRSNSAGIELES